PEELATMKPVPALTAPRTLKVYAELSKARLTVLNVLAAMTAVALSPLPATVPVLLATAAGTALCSAAANATNQISEVPYDAQMARTRMRPLVRRAIKPLHAAGFAVTCGIAGPAILWNFASPLAGAIGAGTMMLYAFVYTPLKRRSILNTWVGAVVGAAPPLIGWTAVGGALVPSAVHPALVYPPPGTESLLPVLEQYVPYLHYATDWPFSSGNPLSGLALFAFMFSWQFPHFNPLAHVNREAYTLAGYKMLSVISPSRNAAVSLRHTVLLVAMSSTLVPLSGLTTWAFAITSLVPNAVLLHGAVKYWRTRSDQHARRLFHLGLIYLPIVLGLMMLHKEGSEW
ncbi:protoheme IX farnesyltransferase, partial [Exidia glandulosa HHB12029]